MSEAIGEENAATDSRGDDTGAAGAPLQRAALQGALRDQLRAQVAGHTSVGYRSARKLLLGGLDVRGGGVECIYTGVPASAGEAMNVEHSWPQSRGANREPMKSDLHHLFVATEQANGARGNHLFGETACDQSRACAWWRNGSELGRSVNALASARADDGGLVFEVRPARRGDLARAQFYFAVRYDMAIEDAAETALRAWNRADPPDADERTRNDAVDAVQHNRNPFIDAPSLVDQIPDF